MSKTIFQNGDPGQGIPGTRVMAEWLNKIFGQNGHKHNGLDEDGSAPIIQDPILYLTENITLDEKIHSHIVVNASNNDVTIVLPDVSQSSETVRFVIKRIDNSNNKVKIEPYCSHQKIEGYDYYYIQFLQSITVCSLKLENQPLMWGIIQNKNIYEDSEWNSISYGYLRKSARISIQNNPLKQGSGYITIAQGRIYAEGTETKFMSELDIYDIVYCSIGDINYQLLVLSIANDSKFYFRKLNPEDLPENPTNAFYSIRGVCINIDNSDLSEMIKFINSPFLGIAIGLRDLYVNTIEYMKNDNGQCGYKFSAYRDIMGDTPYYPYIFTVGKMSDYVNVLALADRDSGISKLITKLAVGGYNEEQTETLRVYGSVKADTTIEAGQGYVVNGLSGVDGQFTTYDGKTIIVSKGIITAITSP